MHIIRKSSLRYLWIFLALTITPLTSAAGLQKSTGLIIITGALDSDAPEVYAWPTNKFLSNMDVGDTAKLQKIPTFQNRNGDISITSLQEIDRNIDPDGILNVEVIGAHGFITSFPVQVAVNSSKEISRIVSINGNQPGVPVDISDARSQNSHAGRSLSEPAMTSEIVPPVVPKSTACATQKTVATYHNRIGQVGQVYSTDSTLATMTFTYEVASTSTLGIGVSASGAYGSFSAAGTSAVSSTGKVEFSPTTTSKHFRTYFAYTKYQVRCVTSGYPVQTWLYYEVRPTGWDGGDNAIAVSAPSATNCVPVSAGTTHSKSSSNATTWSNGLSLKNIVGIDLSSRTGYSTKASVTFQPKKNAHLCGTNGYFGGSPGRLVIKP